MQTMRNTWSPSSQQTSEKKKLCFVESKHKNRNKAAEHFLIHTSDAMLAATA